MRFYEALGVTPGVTAVIGSGGKSGLLNRLAAELREEHRVIICTTTHMYPAPNMPLLTAPDERKLDEYMRRVNAACTGVMAEDGRLHAPALPMARLLKHAEYVLVEADGSKRLPLKAHAPHEPVIPPETVRTVCVVGLSGLGRRISEVVHRPELFSERDGLVTVPLLAQVLNREALADVYFLNQTDLRGIGAARELASLLDRPSVWGSLREEVLQC